MSSYLPPELADVIGREFGGSIKSTRRMSGGDISTAYRIDFDNGVSVFVKWGGASDAEILFAEKTGLEALRSADHQLVIPGPLFASTLDDRPFLALEWLDKVPAAPDHFVRLGRELAQLHRTTSNRYGFETSNFIGRLPQSNIRHDNWIEFFCSERLEPQRRLAMAEGRWRSLWTRMMDRMMSRLNSILPSDPPASLVHGDLWGGNAMPTSTGPSIYDPAVYYGDREVDIAMSELFGGFSSEFYSAYDEAWPRAPGYADRREIYNLYHLLNHLNHFGGSYAAPIQRILRRFSP